MEWVYDNNYDSFSLEVGDYLVSRNILLADVTEAVFMVKTNVEDADADSKVVLTLGDGLVKVAGATESDAVIKAQFRLEDFGTDAMVTRVNYYMGLGIKIASLTKFLEIKPVENRIVILGDFIHD